MRNSLVERLFDWLSGKGFSEKAAARKANLLSSASHTQFRRLKPAENVKLGFTPKARHYVLKSTKRLTKSTPSITAKQYETKKSLTLHGLTPSQATAARKHGAISYSNVVQRERVSKGQRTRIKNRRTKLVEEKQVTQQWIRINSSPRHGSHFRLGRDAAERIEQIIATKERGGLVPNGDWHWAVDILNNIGDTQTEKMLRQSPGPYQIRGTPRAA